MTDARVHERSGTPVSRKELFLVVVQLAAGQLSNDVRAALVGIAADVPSDHIPENLAEAACELVNFAQGFATKPEWMNRGGAAAIN